MTRTGMLIAGVALLAAAGGMAIAQPYGPGAGTRGPGMGMGMGMGRGMMSFTDASSYADALKAQMGITAAQEAAWNQYADTLKGVSGQIQGMHQTMWDAMGTANWQERRDMMNRAFDARQAAFDTVHAAALKLEPSLTATQRDQAAWMLPGLRVRGPGMGMGPGMGRSYR